MSLLYEWATHTRTEVVAQPQSKWRLRRVMAPEIPFPNAHHTNNLEICTLLHT